MKTEKRKQEGQFYFLLICVLEHVTSLGNTQAESEASSLLGKKAIKSVLKHSQSATNIMALPQLVTTYSNCTMPK